MADRPNNGYSPLPHVVVDELLHLLSGAEYKVLSVIIRKTLGWHTYWDEISLSQLMKITGLSKAGVLKSRKVLKDNKLIQYEKVSKSGTLPKTFYALYGETNSEHKLVCSPNQYTEQTSMVIIQELVCSSDKLGGKLVYSPDRQKKGSKESKKIPYPTDSNIVTTPEGGETGVDGSENGKVDSLENEEEPENGNLSYVIHQIQILFCHGAPIELNSPQYEKAVQISEFDRREIEEALEACEKAKYDLNPTKRPRNSGWILNRLMHPEWFGRGSVAGRRTKAGVLAELKEYRKYLEEVTVMADENPREAYLKDMVSESRRMIEKLEAEYGRYKTDRGGDGEKSGDA